MAPTVSAPRSSAGPQRDGLLVRTALATIAAVALVGAAAGIAGGELTSLQVRSGLQRRAALLAVSTSARMQPLPPRARAALAREITEATGVVVTVLGPDGRALAGAPASPLAPAHPWLRSDHARGVTRAWVVATERVEAPATLLVALPLTSARGAVAELLVKLAAALLVVGALALVVSLVVARDIAVDVRAITTRALLAASGEAAALRPLPVRAIDEVGQLVMAFNRLQRRLADEVALHRDALARLEDTERRKETLIATLRHELRTPLNSVLGFADVLLSGVDGELLPMQREDVEAIASSGAHLLRLVDDVLDLSAMASGRYPLARGRVDLAAVARDVVAEAGGIARTRRVDLRLEGVDHAEVYADPVALRRAVTNLVVNAIEHAGGAVTVTVGPRDRGLAVSVTDNGPGIPPGDLRRLFKPFERGRTAEARGAGLGLAITLALVELHGGTLSAHSDVGRGSTFTITLPAGLVPLGTDDERS